MKARTDKNYKHDPKVMCNYRDSNNNGLECGGKGHLRVHHTAAVMENLPLKGVKTYRLASQPNAKLKMTPKKPVVKSRTKGKGKGDKKPKHGPDSFRKWRRQGTSKGTRKKGSGKSGPSIVRLRPVGATHLYDTEDNC
ncbi:MAG: hypothetical protein GY809_16495 [Planctomycetes bacterium]|nr:hypothetical protein [Planctomycetota bacterium]